MHITNRCSIQHNQVDQHANSTINRDEKILLNSNHVYFKLPTDSLFEMMRYLRGPEVSSMLLTCKASLMRSYKDHFWQVLCRLHNPYFQGNPLSHLIQNFTQDAQRRENAYHKLYGLLFQKKEPWIETMRFGYPRTPFLLDYKKNPCRSISILQHDNVLMGGGHSHATGLTSLVVAGNYSGSLWSSTTGKQINTLATEPWFSHALSLFKEAMALPDGNFVTCLYRSKKAYIWSFAGKQIAVLTGHTQIIKCMTVLSNGNIVTGAKDRKICISLPTGAHIKTLRVDSRVKCVASLPQGGFVTGSGDGTIIIWSSKHQQIKVITGRFEDVKKIVVLPNGNLVALVKFGSSLEVRMWLPTGEKCALRLRGGCKKIPGNFLILEVMPYGGFITTAGNEVFFWSTNGQHIATLKEDQDGVINNLAVLRDGRIVTCTEKGNPKVWSSTRRHIATLGTGSTVNQIKTFPNGDILTACKDGTATRWAVDIKWLMGDKLPLSPLNIFKRGLESVSNWALDHMNFDEPVPNDDYQIYADDSCDYET